MIDMITNAKFSFDHAANARTGPKIGRVPGLLSSPQQQSTQPAAIGEVQFIRPAGRLPGFQRPASSLAVARIPAAHRPAIDTKLPSDIHGCYAPFKQRDGAQTAVLEILWASSRSHAQRIGL